MGRSQSALFLLNRVNEVNIITVFGGASRCKDTPQLSRIFTFGMNFMKVSE